MVKAIVAFWKDESGTATLDWAFVTTILVLAAVAGLASVRQVGASAHQERPVMLKR